MYSPPTTTGTMTYSTAAGSGGGTHTSGTRKTITTQPHGGKQQHGGKGECFDTAYGYCHYWFVITSGGTGAAHTHDSKDHWSPSGASAAKTTAASSGVHSNTKDDS